MPPPQLGLVGAEGSASLQKYLTDLVAAQRERELQDREYQQKQQQLDWQQKYQQGMLDVQGQQNLVELYKAGQGSKRFQVVPTVDEKTGKNVSRLYYEDGRVVDLPTQPKIDNPSEFEAYIARLEQGGQKLTPAQYMQEFHNWGDKGLNDEDVKTIADEIVAGRRPPTLRYLSRQGDAAKITAELARRQFDIAGAELDWNSTNQLLRTLNNPQFQRMRSALTTANDSLDIITDLASRWKANSIKPLNWATIQLAKQGTGPEAYIANALAGEIGTLSTELAVVYRGGNTPTDQTLALAGKNLNENWDEETLKKMVEQVRANLNIRESSINQLVPRGVHGRVNTYGFDDPQKFVTMDELRQATQLMNDQKINTTLSDQVNAAINKGYSILPRNSQLGMSSKGSKPPSPPPPGAPAQPQQPGEVPTPGDLSYGAGAGGFARPEEPAIKPPPQTLPATPPLRYGAAAPGLFGGGAPSAPDTSAITPPPQTLPSGPPRYGASAPTLFGGETNALPTTTMPGASTPGLLPMQAPPGGLGGVPRGGVSSRELQAPAGAKGAKEITLDQLQQAVDLQNADPRAPRTTLNEQVRAALKKGYRIKVSDSAGAANVADAVKR